MYDSHSLGELGAYLSTVVDPFQNGTEVGPVLWTVLPALGHDSVSVPHVTTAHNCEQEPINISIGSRTALGQEKHVTVSAEVFICDVLPSDSSFTLYCRIYI